MEKIELKRVFIYNRNKKEIRLDDPDPSLPPAKVAVFYSNIYPELNNAGVVGPKYTDNGEAVYTFNSSIGTKG